MSGISGISGGGMDFDPRRRQPDVPHGKRKNAEETPAPPPATPVEDVAAETAGRIEKTLDEKIAEADPNGPPGQILDEEA